MNNRKLESLPDILTPKELKEFLCIGNNSVYTLLKDGIIDCVKIGKQYRIPKIAIQKYLESCYSGGCIGTAHGCQ